MNQPQTIAMVIAKYSPEVGGAERQARLLARELDRQGFRVIILTRNYHGGPPCETIDRAQVFRSPTFGKSRVLNSLFYLIFSLRWLWRFRAEILLIHGHQAYSPATIGVLGKGLIGRPVVVKVTASNEYGEARELRKLPLFRLRRWLLRRVDLFFVVNPQIIEEFEGLGLERAKIRWVPNGVELPEPALLHPAHREQCRRQLGLLPDAKVLLYVGRLSEEKGLRELLSAWKDLVRQYPTGVCLLVGEGGAQRSLEAELREQVRAEGLSERVRFVGRVDEVGLYFAAADVFALPSVSEGMSNSLLEALAWGVPVVATDIPATRAVLVAGEEGLVVPVGDAPALRAAIERLFGEKALAQELSRRARQKAERVFRVEAVGAKIVELYREVAGK